MHTGTASKWNVLDNEKQSIHSLIITKKGPQSGALIFLFLKMNNLEM